MNTKNAEAPRNTAYRRALLSARIPENSSLTPLSSRGSILLGRSSRQTEKIQINPAPTAIINESRKKILKIVGGHHPGKHQRQESEADNENELHNADGQAAAVV